MSSPHLFLQRQIALLTVVFCLGGSKLAYAGEGALFIHGPRALAAEFGQDWREAPVAVRAQSLRRLAESLPVGGAILLPDDVACGVLDFRAVADDVQITGGTDGEVVFGGGQRGMQLVLANLDQRFAPGVARPFYKRRPLLLSARGEFRDFAIFDEKQRPASDCFALFCNGSIRIEEDVKHCVWIAGANSFGMRTVTAHARVDDSLFLWFGINWPFQDYNAHLNPRSFEADKKGRERADWLDHAQMVFNCQGGGNGTRLYGMVETNYGNPGPGVILENCRGMALYQGTTERASSQGPGVYWLKNCEGVQLGLRGINSFGRMDHYIKAAMPSRDVTIEGGRGNILHGLRIWGHAQEATIVNSDPALQLWCVSAQYETQGVEAPGITRFAFSPGDQLPTADWVKAHEPEFADYAEWLAVESGKMFKLAPDGPEIAKLRATWKPKWIDAMRRGRFHDTPMTATAEQTFVVGGRDLTREQPEGAVPAPPSIPATDAPRYDRPLAFTQDAEFGKALIDAGADPTGVKPSDEAFARVMFGMSRDEVQSALDDAAKADGDFRAARTRKDESGMKAAKERIAAAVEKLDPVTIERDDKGRERRVKAKRGKLEVPAGRFRIERPLVLFAWDGLLGAGREKTTLFSTKPITLIERRGAGGSPTIGNLALEGGRVGLDFLGADHGEPVSPTLHAYTAGANVFNITFRGQSFAGLWVGNREPGVMGGAEHDQNKYVQLTFENTGDYGIYMNQPMLDKWLLLHCDFRG